MSDATHEIVQRAATAPETLHPAVQALILGRPGEALTPDALEKLLAVQERYERGKAQRAFAAARSALLDSLPGTIARDAKADFPTRTGGRMSYTYATLGRVLDAVNGPLRQHGFSHHAETETLDGDRIRVTVRLTHELGHSESAHLTAQPDRRNDKISPVQQVVAVTTYLRRNLLMILLGIATADMPDADDSPGSEGPGERGEHVDTARNLRAMADLSGRGVSRAQAEEIAGAPLPSWTAAHLDRLRERFARETKPAAAGPANGTTETPPAPAAASAPPTPPAPDPDAVTLIGTIRDVVRREGRGGTVWYDVIVRDGERETVLVTQEERLRELAATYIAGGEAVSCVCRGRTHGNKRVLDLVEIEEIQF